MQGERCPEADIKGPVRGYFEAWKVPVDARLSTKYIKEDLQGDLWSGFNNKPICLINWDSPKQVIPLFKHLGFDLLAKDKETGEWKDSVGAEVIEPQQDKSTIAYLYLQYKAAKKVTSTYGQNVIDQINEKSGRVHTTLISLEQIQEGSVQVVRTKQIRLNILIFRTFQQTQRQELVL